MEMYDQLQCVDRALGVYGSNMKQAIYWRLTSKEGVSSDGILSNSEAFVRVLHEIFGNGYNLAERSIVREMKRTFYELPPSCKTIPEAFDMVSREIVSVPLLTK